MRQDRPGFPLAMVFLYAGQRALPCRIVAQEQRRCCGKGPLEMTMPAFFARRAQALARGFLGTLDQATRGDTILHAGEPVDIVEFVEEHQAEKLANPRHSLPQIQGRSIVWPGRFQDGEFQSLAQVVLIGDKRQSDLKSLWHREIGKAFGNALTVGFVSNLLPALGQVVWTSGIMAMGQQCSAFAHQVGATA